MEVRFVLPSDDGEPQFDRTVDLAGAPLPGDTIGIDPPADSPAHGTDAALLVEVEFRRWYVNGTGAPVLEVWLDDSEGCRRNNNYVHSGCRYGFEQMMNRSLRT